MKRIVNVGVLSVLFFLSSSRANSQVTELAQLALNIEKLAQFKQILSDLKKGYEIISGGYNTIKNISEGNFKLHQVFLDGLMDVSPAVKKYKRVSDIINCQLQIVKEYKKSYSAFKAKGVFRPDELSYMAKVYENLIDLSVKNLDDLFTVITANKLRMSDDERLAAIDKIFNEIQDKLSFLRQFNNSASVLSLQRFRDKYEVERLQSLNGLR